MKCKICNTEKENKYFYKGFTCCKECISKNLNSKTSIYDAQMFCKQVLEDSNYIVNNKLLYDIFFNDNGIDEYRGLKNDSKLSLYLKKINSLPQYSTYRYKEEQITNKEKSDIEFINDDIKELKIKISKSLEKEDFNAHNKWMNSLRDALELREKLKEHNDISKNYNILFTLNNINDSDEFECKVHLPNRGSVVYRGTLAGLSEWIFKDICENNNNSIFIYHCGSNDECNLASRLYKLGCKTGVINELL